MSRSSTLSSGGSFITHNPSPALSQVVCGSMASTDRELDGRRAAQHLVAGFADRDRLAGVVPW